MSARYQKFLESKQEPLRLSIALEEFFREEDPARREAYGQYLRRRIRPAAAALVDEEDIPRLERLEALGWLTGPLVDELLRQASVRQKPAALVWLLRLKRDRFGYAKRDFSL